ncbi:MAG: zinc-ribbon domain containing protein [Chloroflexi bacterium]|nr:zinc-ribbon domain containing protein [Chloroflexota bacterium]
MSFQDKSLQCSDCGVTFTFSADDQEFFQSKGYTNEPKRCPACRQARKTERYGNSGSSYNRPQRQMFPVKCAQCGKDTEVPFEPRGDKPVYCSDCYRKVAKVSR